MFRCAVTGVEERFGWATRCHVQAAGLAMVARWTIVAAWCSKVVQPKAQKIADLWSTWTTCLPSPTI